MRSSLFCPICQHQLQISQSVNLDFALETDGEEFFLAPQLITSRPEILKRRGLKALDDGLAECQNCDFWISLGELRLKL